MNSLHATGGEQKERTGEFSLRVWIVCGLLLFASAINYMDRQTLAAAQDRIKSELEISNEGYGDLETGFGYAFAAGSVIFGILADVVSVRYLYPVVLIAWSAVGFATGLVSEFEQLFWCRTMLGFFEAGHWPCGIKAVRALLSGKGRSLGNSVLQSGTSIGAVITPLLMLLLLTPQEGSWRGVFQIVGAIGVLWVVVWLAVTRADDFLPRTDSVDAGVSASVAIDAGGDRSHSGFRLRDVTSQILVILVVIALINTNWQILRAWMPTFMQKGRGYAESEMLLFTSVWYVATDVGCLGAGALATWFGKRGWSLFSSRWTVFAACSLVCLASIALPMLERGPALLIVLALMGAGSLGVFPIYHAFTQDISGAHQGKITGLAGVAAWGFSFTQKFYGRWVDETGRHDLGLIVFGCFPLAAAIILLCFWPRRENKELPR